MTRTSTLRERVEADEPLLTPGVFDGFTAKLATSVGFGSVYLGGYAAGAATTATEPMITSTEMRQRAREVVHATDAPVTVDANAGFGNLTNTYRIVQQFARDGVSAIHIEDQVYPKRLHYHAGVKHITDEETFVRKFEAAAQARAEMEEDIVLVARSDAGRGQRRETEGEGIEDAVERINACMDVGADVGFAFPRGVDELEYVHEHVDGPVMFASIEGYDPRLSRAEIEALGLDWVIYPISATVAMAQRLKAVYAEIRDDGDTSIGTQEFADARDEIEAIIDLPRYYELEEDAGLKGYDGTPDTKQ